MTTVRPRWARILLAAVRLAAIYTAGVLVLSIPLAVRAWREDTSTGAAQLLGLSASGVICFGLGFVALAAVRRLGFALLWGLLTAAWVALRGNAPDLVLGDVFLVWSVFAAPLYMLSAVGLSAETGGSRWSKLEVVVTLLIWLVIAGLAFFPAEPPIEGARIWDAPYPMTLRGYVYVAWPFVIAARELGRVGVALWRSRKEA